ncbi:hypothetical protein pb186bvf_001350 [Paramecium bursaria]
MMSRNYLEGKLKRKKKHLIQEEEIIFCLPKEDKRKADNIWIENEEGMLELYNKSKQVKTDIEDLIEQTQFLSTNKQPIVTLQKIKELNEVLVAKREFFHIELQKQNRQKNINQKRSFNFIKLKLQNNTLVHDDTEEQMQIEGEIEMDFYRMEKNQKENLQKSQYVSYPMDTKKIEKYINYGGCNYNEEDDIEDKFSDQSEQSDIDYPEEESDHSDKEQDSDDYSQQSYHQPNELKPIEYEDEQFDGNQIVDDTQNFKNFMTSHIKYQQYKNRIRDFDYNKDF